MMDPERVRAYLQVACAGLGFDIGEVWWTSNETGTSTLATIEEKKEENGSAIVPQGSDKKLRFVQLYTSKSYADRRPMLVSPDSDRRSDGEDETITTRSMPCTSADLQKHVLSPRLVDAISNTAQVVWANCQKREGLLGRSDMKLQTAVGMPVAVDANGNMCVVVMFSPNNLQSTDDAMEYLQFISRSATSSSIPCLLPVFDSNTMRPALMPSATESHHNSAYYTDHHWDSPSLGEGVTARYVSLEDSFDVDSSRQEGWDGSNSQSHGNHDLTAAPKDCFGIPMLPSFAELGNSVPVGNLAGSESPICDAFDEASFGVWSTIMHSSTDEVGTGDRFGMNNSPSADLNNQEMQNPEEPAEDDDSDNLIVLDKPIMPPHQRERLEEFCAAFLEMSVFDVSDVWIPSAGQDVDRLCHVTSVTSTDTNESLNEFKRVSANSQIKPWSGAVGRAYASGNPVWSANYGVIVDSGRVTAFDHARIRTALAIPIFSSGAVSPSCVLCCYSLVRTDSVPTVLRFVQQALRLLWTGLDKVEPHESIGKDLWKDVAPADLGEMAADIEMQHAFLKKKRPHHSMTSSQEIPSRSAVSHRDRSSSLAIQLQSLEVESSDYGSPADKADFTTPYSSSFSSTSESSPIYFAGTIADNSAIPSHDSTYHYVQSHLQDAVRSVGEAIPWTIHQHLATNSEGTKRAHVQIYGNQEQSHTSLNNEGFPGPSGQRQDIPLNMPQPLPIQYMMQSNFCGPVVSPSDLNRQYQVAANSMAPSSQSSVSASHSQMNFPASYRMESIPDDRALSFSTNAIAVDSNGQNVFIATSHLGVLMTSPATSSPPPESVTPELISSYDSPYGFSGEMMDGSGKSCRIQGCDDMAVARRPYCLRHSGNRLCEHIGCSKCAQGSTRFCIAHGGGRRCTVPGCDKGARDKFFCAAHGGGKRCAEDGCNKSAVGGSSRCTSHGGGRRCTIEGCDKSAQSSTRFCVKHGGGKKCAFGDCEKVARGRTFFCAAHGGGVRCKLEGCNRVAIGKLQLCRTHGGGARSRSKASKGNSLYHDHQTTAEPGLADTF